MSSRRDSKHQRGPLVVVSRPQGAVVGQNSAACQLMGHPDGASCWQRVGQLDDVEGLPCEKGCTARLVQEACDQTVQVSWRGVCHQLSCVPVNGKVVSVLAPCASSPGTDELLQHLTERETDVLHLLAEGLTSAQIGARLGIGSGTVRSHVEHLRNKLMAPNRAAIVGRAFRLGYLS